MILVFLRAASDPLQKCLGQLRIGRNQVSVPLGIRAGYRAVSNRENSEGARDIAHFWIEPRFIEQKPRG